MPQLNQPIPIQKFELIRNRIANILVDEITNQITLQYSDLFAMGVFIERFPNFDKTELPVLNVSLARGSYDNEDMIQSDGTYTYYVDAFMRFSAVKNADNTITDGSSLAAIKVQRAIAFCRTVLKNQAYKTLGFAPPFLNSVTVSEFNIANPDREDMEHSIMARITVEVVCPETSELAEGLLLAGYDTQVLLGDSQLGYIFSGNAQPLPPITCEPATWRLINTEFTELDTGEIPSGQTGEITAPNAAYRVQYVGGELIEEGEIPSGGSVTVNVPVCPESGSVEWELRDEDNNLLDSGTQPAGIPLTITAPDGLITITDSDDGVLYVVNINSGGSETQIINDSTVNINKSDSVLIAAQTVKAEGVENYNVADSVITLNNTVPTLISTTNVKATDPATIVAPDAEISLNGVKMEDIPSNTSLNISVRRQTGSFQVGSKQGQHWRIANGTLNVNKSDGSLISARTLAAEENTGYNVADSVGVLKDTDGNVISSTNIKATESEDIIAPDGSLQNSDASETLTVRSGQVNKPIADINIEVNTVVEGTIPALKDVKILITDGVNPVTPDDVSVAGDTVTVEVPQPKDIFIKGLFKASSDTMETLTIDSDSAGTYTSISDDGSSGSITLSKNGSAFAAFSSPLALVATDTLDVKRTVDTAAGFFKLTGTY
jgi:hypothetical protein